MWVRCRRRLFFGKKRAPYFWKPLTCGYVAAGAFFFSEKRAPYFWKPLTCGYVAAGAFFFGKKGPHISGHGSTRSGHGSSGHGTEIFGTARIHQILARHGTSLCYSLVQTIHGKSNRLLHSHTHTQLLDDTSQKPSHCMS